MQAFAGGFAAETVDALLATLGDQWELAQLTFKPYPCGSIAQPYMDCALRLRDKHQIRPADIASVSCRTAEGPVPRLWEPLAAKHRPANGYAAKFSLPYLLAAMFVKGRASLAEFTDESVRDEAVLEVAGKVGYELDPTIDYPRQFIGQVTVRLRDGRRLEESQDHPRGGPDSPDVGRRGRSEVSRQRLPRRPRRAGKPRDQPRGRYHQSGGCPRTDALTTSLEVAR